MARPLHILLLSGLDETLSVERATLRQLGARVRGLRSGRSALEYLAATENEKPDVLVCTETLSDMGAGDFLRALGLLSARPGMWSGERQPPVLVVCGGRAEAFLELGAAAAVGRPYTARTMSEALVAAQNGPRAGEQSTPVAGAADMFFVKRQRAAGQKLPAEAAGDAAAIDLPEALRTSTSYREVARAIPAVQAARPGQFTRLAELTHPAQPVASEAATEIVDPNPLLHTRNGLRALRAGRLAEARGLFKAALAADSLDLEACLGMAGVYRRRENPAGEQRWLNRAALICLETGQKGRARSIQERLPREVAGNPYLSEARHLLLEGNYAEAAEAFLKLSLRKGQPPLHQLVARAAQLTDSPEDTLHELCVAFRHNGQPGLAASLHQRLLAEPEEADRLEFEPQSFWTRFPRLYEVMAVARFTLQAWRTNP